MEGHTERIYTPTQEDTGAGGSLAPWGGWLSSFPLIALSLSFRPPPSPSLSLLHLFDPLFLLLLLHHFPLLLLLPPSFSVLYFLLSLLLLRPPSFHYTTPVCFALRLG